MIFPRSLTTLERIAIVALLLAAVAEIGAFIAMPFDGYDSPSHLFWVAEWQKMWASGVLYPRWMPDSYHGFGAPSFYLYPPLAYMISSAVGLVLPGVSATTLIKVVTLLTLALSGVAMYLYLRWRSDSRTHTFAIIASLVYAFAPYRFFNMTVRAAFSEHVAFMFVPLAFWGMDLIIRARRERKISRDGFSLLSVSISLLILSNLPTAASVLLLLFVYAIARKEWLPASLSLALSSLIAACLAAAYLLPVVFFYHDAQLTRLWAPFPFVQCSPVLGIFTKLAVMINTYNLIGLCGAILLLAALRRTNVKWKWLLVAIILLQLPPLAYYLFLYVFPFTIVQLPARLTAGLLIVLCIIWMNELNEQVGQYGRKTASIVVLFWSLCMIPLIVVQLSGIHLRARIDRPPDDPPEYATRWSPSYDSTANARAAYDSGWTARGTNIISTTRTPYADTIEYNSPVSTNIVLHRTYWPTWNAAIDSQDVQTAADSLGRLSIAVSAGRHRIVAKLVSSDAEHTGRWISIVTLFLFTIGSVSFSRRKS